mgnify:CR=1 FL=1
MMIHDDTFQITKSLKLNIEVVFMDLISKPLSALYIFIIQSGQI